MGPMLTNAMYYRVLVLPAREGATIFDVTDYQAVVGTPKNPEYVDVYAVKTVRVFNSRMERTGLTLSNEETESVLITHRGKENTIIAEVGGYVVILKPANKYGGND